MLQSNLKYCHLRYGNRYYLLQYSKCGQHTQPSNDKKHSENIRSKSTSKPPSYLRDGRILFSSIIEKEKLPVRQRDRERLFKVRDELSDEVTRDSAKPLILRKFLEKQAERLPLTETTEEGEVVETFPYSQHSTVEMDQDMESHQMLNIGDFGSEPISEIKSDVHLRKEEYEKGSLEPIDLDVKSNLKRIRIGKDVQVASRLLGMKEDMDETDTVERKKEYGTADSEIPVSNVPCGGCGALLHCKDPSIPGFKPKEVFIDVPNHHLRSTVCQRCHFLKTHNIALQVRVNPETYLDMLRPIKEKNALVLLLVDLVDAPCSIHPRIMDVIGHQQPVIIVGNKVDLLPMDGHDCLKRIQDALQTLVKKTCLRNANIKHTCLISAESGFGVEELITVIQKNWQTKGDIYIIGSTNCGKSTLFNTFLHSDMCKVQASNLILKATTSPWPGTTLNMLKFPIMKPSGRRLQARHERLREEQLVHSQQFKSKERMTFNTSLATLKKEVRPTFTTHDDNKEEMTDIFSHPVNTPPRFKETTYGINEKKPEFLEGKWCYDTPGALQPDQCLNLLTHEELTDVVSKEMLVPESYKLRAGRSIFFGGLGRVDILYVHHTEPSSIGRMKYHVARLTTFRSPNLPICVVPTVLASAFYRDNLGTPLLQVPRGSEERLKAWPALACTDYTIQGDETKNAIADVVLSSAGFLSVTVAENSVCHLRVWTPGGRGAYLRQPPLVAQHVRLRGASSPYSVKYGNHILYKASSVS